MAHTILLKPALCNL